MVLAALLLVASFVTTFFGLISLSQATSGVGGIAIGCLLAIVARIAQAGHHHKKLLEQLEPQRVDALRRSVSASP